MLKHATFTAVLFVLDIGLATAQTTPNDTLTYFVDGKVVSSSYFQTLDANTLSFIDVNKPAKTVRGFTQDAAPTDIASYQSKGAKIDWSVAKELQEVSFVVDNRVTEAQEARAITIDQIESVHQLPPSGKDEIGSFGKNGVIVITTKKKR